MTKVIKVDNNSDYIEDIKSLRSYRSRIIKHVKNRLQDFTKLNESATNNDLFRELVFCILTANASAKMGLKAINELDSIIFTGDKIDIENRLRGVYRFPASRADYIFRTRQFFQQYCDMDIQSILNTYSDKMLLRDFLVKNVVGIAYKECSHFLRNIGYKGFAILDKHVISMLNQIGCIVRKPKNKKEYRKIEQMMIDFAKCNDLDIDELDLLFWSYKTGEIIK